MSVIQNKPGAGSSRKDLIEGLYPLSGLQQGMLFHGLYDGKVGAYLEQLSCDLIGVNLEIFTKSWEYLIQRHSVLRSAFYYDKFNVPVQCVYKEIKLPVESLDYSLMEPSEQAEAIKLYEQEEKAKGFDFNEAPLMRLALIRLSNERYRMLWIYHHIILDGWSMPILIEEFLNSYESLSKGDKPLIREIDRYEDYIRYIERRDKKQEQSYWENYLGKIDSGTLLPFISKTEERTKGIGNYTSFSLNISIETSGQIRNYVQKNRLTINTLMQGVWAYLLYNYTKSTDIVYGVIVSGRPDDLPDVEHRVGMYINTMPLYANIDLNIKIEDWLIKLQNEQVSLRQFQHTPLFNIKEWKKIQGDLFDSLIVFENYPMSKVIGTKAWSLQVEHFIITEHNNYPLSIVISGAEQLKIRFSYNTDLLEKYYVEKIGNHFENVLMQMLENINGTLGNIKLINKEEEEELKSFNSRQSEYPADKSIVSLFEEQSRTNPESIAITFEEEEITYKELNQRSNQLANYLQSKGVKEETLVPICIERSIEMLVGILGILKAGGAYVPIDPEYPQDRISYMIRDTAGSILLSSNAGTKKLQQLDEIEIIEIDSDKALISNQSIDNLKINIDPDNLAYIIYTSGSTGKPKGVMVTHKNVVSLVKGIDYVSMGNKDRLLSTGSSSFDATTFEYWGMLLNGGQLILCEESRLLNSGKLREEIEDRKVNKMWFTSSWFNQLVETDISIFEGLQTILVGGEKLSEQHIQKIRQTYPEIEIINGYGPTENTTFSLTYKINETNIEGAIPIGRPLNNRSAYVLGEDLQLVPVGVTGEIYLGGAGVARGYLNQENLTAEKFVKDPFSNEGAGMYKSGDLGRWLPDGIIEYLGRVDDQVKIRGYRIELGEIETVIMQNEFVKQAVILAKEDNQGEKRLIGYIIPEGKFEKETIITYLQSKLPDYMVPAVLIEMNQFPLTSNGKIDKKALPDAERLSEQLVAPRNEIEEKLSAIWLDILKLEEVSVHDDFFELGGHSLLAIRLMSMLRKDMGIEVKIGDIFDYPTITMLAGYISGQSSGILMPSIEVKPRPDNIPLSFSQERLWFIDQLEGSVQYHIPIILKLSGDLNINALSKSIQTIINRHEVLRTVFRVKDGNPLQYIKDKDLWELNIVNGQAYKGDDSGLQKYLQQLIKKPFDLANDHMLKATLLSLEDQEYLLLVTMHHIASDGWSMPLIVKEVGELYKCYSEDKPVNLLPLNIQYADFAIWQRNYLKGELLESKINYWKEKLSGVEVLELPVDFSRPAVHTTRGAVKGFDISKELTNQLNVLSQREGATLFMGLLSAFKILLHRYTGQEDVCVGSPIANRTQPEVEGMIGFFVNTLALRSQVKDDDLFVSLLQQVKANTMKAYEHQDVPFEKVVEVVVKERDLSRTPLFQAVLILQNTPDIPQFELGNIQLRGESIQNNTSKFELTFAINENAAGLRVSIEYNTDLFKEETIDRMFNHYKELLNSIVKSPREKIGKLKILTQAEENKLLHEFNDTEVDFPKDKNIVDLFEEQAEKYPDSIAVIFEDEELSYSELNKRSNQLARYLKNQGLKEEALVPICMERGFEMIIGILGILKAGGAYVPIDPDYPEDRISYMLGDTGALLVISSNAFSKKIPKSAHIDIIELDKVLPEISSEETVNLNTKISPNNLAYVIYTSGSTGKPKGVMIEHNGVVNLSLSQGRELRLKPQMKTLQFASFGFDASCYEIFNTFLSGGNLVIPKKEDILSVEKFSELINKNKVEVVVLPPSVQHVIKDVFGTIKTIVSAGEPLNEVIGKHIQSQGIRLINAYGPTENTVCATLTDDPFKDGNTIVIGHPISNVKIYILDKSNKLCPLGITGEICIAGVQVARGYLNRPDLTAEKFIKNPFDKKGISRLYKSGDLGRWLPDGNIEYLGRIDDQVKLRGYRIEMGEIENVLLAGNLASQVVVLVKEDKKENKRLIGYVISGDKKFNRENAISWLHTKLPDYMVPAIWIELEHFPLTSSGKIDKKALPDPDESTMTKNEYLAPRNEMEEKLVGIWQELLGVEKIGVYDNFFELGGHSLLAMRLLTAIHKELETEILVIKNLFQFPTIDELSKYLAIKLDMNPQEQNSEEFELIDL